MQIDMSQYRGPCACGRTHGVVTSTVLIEAGAARRLREIAGSLRLTARGAVVCDTNTRPYALAAVDTLGGFLLDSTPLLCLDAAGLHADEKGVAALEAALPADAAWLLAAGSGTVHDITRYVACARGIPFVSFPTAASVDGFVSSVCAMTWRGFKKTTPGVSPLAVVADTEIFSRAPARLAASGVGDVLGKYTALADWEIASLVTGEDFCPRIAGLEREAVDRLYRNAAAIRAGKPEAMEQLMYALLLSGIAMQMNGNSRPASGAEHHLSHLWEMEALNPHTGALHGEKVGVGLLLALREYKRLFADGLPAVAGAYRGVPDQLLREKLGALYPSIAEENAADPLAAIDPATLRVAMPRVAAIVAALPEPEPLAAKMREAGCPLTLEDIGLDSAIGAESLTLSPFVRNRVTLMRLRGMLR